MTVTKARPGTFNADAARAARAEAVGEPFRFVFGGDEFTIPTPKEWPIAVTSALAAGQLAEAMRLLLGDVQDVAFSGHLPTLGDVEAILGAVAEWQGITLGE